MPKIYFYKLTCDDGGAPCVQDRLLSLAICKPMIRTMAEPGALIFGFAANSLHSDNRLLYIAKVTDKIRNGEYYSTHLFARRGDNIYERRGSRFYWREGARHHGPNDISHDLGDYPDYPKANVLLSTSFRYFGANGTDEYKSRFLLIKDAVEGLGRGHRVRHDEPLRMQLLALKERVWQEAQRGGIGTHTSAPRCGVSHRSRSCGVVGDSD